MAPPKKTSKSDRTPRRAEVEKPFKMPLTVAREALLEDGRDHRFRQLIYDLGRLGEVVNGARRHLAQELKVTPTQYSIIMVVAEHEGTKGVSIVDVASHLHVSGAFITTQVNQLVELGLIEKLPNPDDGRGVLLRPTATSKAEIQRVAAYLRNFNDAFFGGMDRKTFQAFSVAVANLIQTGERALLDATADRGRLSATARRSVLRGRSKS
jgi:DNA-binding MarR family transcriptional regulator